MVRKFSLGLALCLMATPQIASSQQPARQAERTVASATAASGAHSGHAVLRYDLSTAGACRSWTDQPPELCVLLALHVIHMSEHPPKVL
jgi:hypothetical protein